VIFLIGWTALRDKRFRLLALLVVLIEVILGFAGYFGAFKTILFLAIVLIVGSGIGLRRVLRPSLLGILLAAGLMSAFWQAVKDDYRVFLSDGERGQVVRAPLVSRFIFLLQSGAELRGADLTYGFESGLDRIGYLEFLARTIQTVPARVPYQNGRLWLEALTHVVTPRFLFPEKAAINDSERTREFTGRWVAGADDGTSISIGYVGESYIDFGPLVMFIPIALLGFFWGWAYRTLATRTRHKLLGIAISTNLILGGAIYFEWSNIKLLGGAMSSLLVLWCLLLFWGDAIWRFVAPLPERKIVVAENAGPSLRVAPEL